jgi:sensor histidine kinase YesM
MLSRFIPNIWVQLLLTTLLGAVAQLVINVIFNLVYIDYPVLTTVGAYLYAIVFSLAAVSGLAYINKGIRIRFAWSQSVTVGFLVQAVVDISFVLGLLVVSRYLIFNFIVTNHFNRLLDEVIIAAVVLFLVALYLALEFGFYLLDKWRKSLADLERFKKEKAEYQFEMLRMQVNPHFLFNSLNTLSSLIFHNPDMASVFIRKLSYVYRYVLETRSTIMLTLDEEMEFVNSYVYMLELRLHEKLTFIIDIDEKYLRHYIVPMTLQILIENAVKHNVASGKMPLKIHMYTDENDYIVVRNRLQRKRTTRFSSGIGLENIRSRYRFIVDKQVEVVETENHFTVRVPLIERYEDINS